MKNWIIFFFKILIVVQCYCDVIKPIDYATCGKTITLDEDDTESISVGNNFGFC